MPLNQVASVHAPEPALLVVQPFDKTVLQDIERAIMQGDLGLNPANDGNIIRIPIPPLNEERRKDLARLLHKMAEEGRISIRHARKTARDDVQAQMKDHEIGEDEGHRQLDEIDKLTHRFTERIDEMLAKKEAEVMEI
jgi:ribosome recycling factor